MAYEGRARLLFHPRKMGPQSYLPCVRDARSRYRNCETPKCLDLGIVLTSFNNSKEKNPRDRIYAALGIVKPQELCQDIIPDYKKLVEVFYEASCHIIGQRKDLSLWSTKALMPRRTMVTLPS